jgi:hypothetical protein
VFPIVGHQFGIIQEGCDIVSAERVAGQQNIASHITGLTADVILLSLFI